MLYFFGGMMVPAMPLEAKLAHAREDLVRVQRKYDRKITELERAVKKSRDKKPQLFQDDYPSPGRNNWLVTLRATKKSTTMYTVVWWHYPKTGLEALTVKPDGASFYFDSHFFQRYRIRESAVADPHDNMRRFFRTNYDMAVKPMQSTRHGLREAAGVAAEGMLLGTVRTGGIIACDTFLSQDMLRKDQVELQERLKHEAYWLTLSPVQLQQMDGGAAEGPGGPVAGNRTGLTILTSTPAFPRRAQTSDRHEVLGGESHTYVPAGQEAHAGGLGRGGRCESRAGKQDREVRGRHRLP
jgi:hypothetical protein